MQKALFLYNPAAGRGRIARNVGGIVDIFSENGWELTPEKIDFGRNPFDAHPDIRMVIAAGGDGTVSVVTDNARLFMPMAELVDLDKERERIKKELANAVKQLEGQIAKLANEKFVSRAPEAVVNAEREKKVKLDALIENLKLSLENLGK